MNSERKVQCDYCGETRIDYLQCSWRCYRCYAIQCMVEQGKCSKTLFTTTFSKSLKDLEQPEVYRLAREWRCDRSVIIHGPVGTGKSFLSRCMLNVAFDRHLRIIELNAQLFEKRWRRGYEQDVIGDLCATGCLLLDDADKALSHERAVTAFLNVMDARHNAKRPTIITSNFDDSGLQRYLESVVPHNISIAAAILDRFKPKPLFLPLKGKSLR